MRNKLVFIMLSLAMLTAGCSADIPEMMPETTRSAELTEEQKELLKNVSVSEGNIDEGDLYGWQEELLDQYDFAMGYLNKKYPSHTFHIVNCDWLGQHSPATFFFTAEDGKQYDLNVDTSGTEYTATDTFFGSLIEDDYGMLMEEYLKPRVPCLACRTYFDSAVGEEYDETVTAQQVFDGQGKVQNLTEIYLDSIPEDGLVETIKSAVRNKGLYGAYEVYFLTDTPAETDRDLIAEYVKANRELITYQTFQNF